MMNDAEIRRAVLSWNSIQIDVAGSMELDRLNSDAQVGGVDATVIAPEIQESRRRLRAALAQSRLFHKQWADVSHLLGKAIRLLMGSAANVSELDVAAGRLMQAAHEKARAHLVSHRVDPELVKPLEFFVSELSSTQVAPLIGTAPAHP